jgi:predicted transglutaminase-like cysteine proteinase
VFCVPDKPFRRIARLAIAAAAVLALSGAAQAFEFQGKPMQILGAARAPIGHVAFCAKYPRECAGGGAAVAIQLNAERFAELDRVNRAVNDRIKPTTDLAAFKTAEIWSIPTTQGDCEDYVLLKKKLLVQAGWNAASLLITVVRDQKGAGHAVLTAVTDNGDLILDNQRDGVVPWERVPYQFVKRQSQSNPRSWVFVGTADAGTGVASTR